MPASVPTENMHIGTIDVPCRTNMFKNEQFIVRFQR